MFGSRTILEHLVRGVIGVGALAAAAVWTAPQPWLWLVAVPVALVAFRGCPMCWTVGLAETAIARVRGRSGRPARAGGCGVPRAAAPRERDSIHGEST